MNQIINVNFFFYFFFLNLVHFSMNHMSLPVGELMEAIKRDFGSFQKMKEKMSAATVAVQGSGWGWLGYSKDTGRLCIAACGNQDPLQGTTGQSNNFSPIVFSTCSMIRSHLTNFLFCSQVSSRSSVLMCGNTPTIFSTKMCGQTILRPSGM